METKIETTNTGGKVLAYNGDELVGRLEFSYEGNVMRIEHTYAYKRGMGVGNLLVSAANDYAINKGLRVLPVCSFAVRGIRGISNSRIYLTERAANLNSLTSVLHDYLPS